MNERNKVLGVGLVLVGVLVACSTGVRELGDEPVGGAGGSNGQAGSTVLPKGGRPATVGGAAGDGPSAAGADAGVCFSPTQRLDLAREMSGEGCPCEGEEDVCVSDTEGDVVWYGMLTCVDGHWTTGPNSCDQDCFSPTNRPDLAIEPGGAGCACDNDPPECVLTMHDGRPWRVSLYCVEGRWTSADDGVCGSGGEADCKTGGVVYPHGARNVPDPSSCNTCSCDDGQITGCTEINCPLDCPEGTKLATSCAQCGPADDCEVVERDCMPACAEDTDTCALTCSEGACVNSCG